MKKEKKILVPSTKTLVDFFLFAIDIPPPRSRCISSIYTVSFVCSGVCLCPQYTLHTHRTCSRLQTIYFYPRKFNRTLLCTRDVCITVIKKYRKFNSVFVDIISIYFCNNRYWRLYNGDLFADRLRAFRPRNSVWVRWKINIYKLYTVVVRYRWLSNVENNREKNTESFENIFRLKRSRGIRLSNEQVFTRKTEIKRHEKK